MADIKIDEELLLRAGLGIGYAFAPFFRGILEGVEDYTIEQAAVSYTHLDVYKRQRWNSAARSKECMQRVNALLTLPPV